MKKITQEEFDHLKFQPRGKELHSTVKSVLMLSIGEGIVISAKEWPLKMAPSTYFIQNADKFNGMFFRARKLANDEGYAIIRVS